MLPVLATLDRGVHLYMPRSMNNEAVVIDEETAAKATADFERIHLCVIDDALSDHALTHLRKQLVESTVWYDAKRGHLGAYLEDGIASGLLLQVVEEFGAKLPDIVGPKRLVQAWGYKYHGNLQEADMGIRPHADEGAVTVNCWLTPDRYNLREGSGGLRIYNASVPDTMPFLQANRDFRAVRKHVEHADRVDVDHRQNRCVVFRSALVHGDAPFYFGLQLTAKRKMILTNCAACAAPLAHNAPRCVRCQTRYCNKTCQHDHWRRGHKQICKKIHRGGNAEQYNADKKYKEAVAVAVHCRAKRYPRADWTRFGRRGETELTLRTVLQRFGACALCAEAAPRSTISARP